MRGLAAVQMLSLALSFVVGFAPGAALATSINNNHGHKTHWGETQPVGSAANPTVNSCGLDIALVLDNSASINSTELSTMKTDFTNLVTTLSPTPSEFSVTKFNTTASVVHAFTLNTGDTTTALGGITTSSGHTNFQAGLIVASSTFDPRIANANVVIFASDGDPNTKNHNSSTMSTNTTDAENAAVTQANAMKAAGTRIITIGIGDHLTAANLIKLSSPDAYYAATDYTDLGTALQEVATDLCGGTITVQKMIDSDGSSETPAVAAADGWDFTVGGHDAVTDNSGKTPAVAVTQGSQSVVETAKDGYDLQSATCVNQSQQTVGTLNGSTVSGITVGPLDIISCTFTNVPNKGTLHVVKHVVGNNTDVSNFNYVIDTGAQTAFVDGGTAVSEPVGKHSVTEQSYTNYTTTYASDENGHASDCNNLDVTPNGDVTCTITNTYVPPVITCNDNAETDIVSDTTTADDSGTTVAVNPSDIPGILPGVWVDPTATSSPLTGASWIWSNNYMSQDTVSTSTTEVFTKTFNVTGSVNSASLDMSADNGYTITVNGNPIDDQSSVEQNYLAVHHYDLSSAVHSGANTLQISVINFPLSGSTFANNPGGLVYRLVVKANECDVSNQCVSPVSDTLSNPQVVLGTSPEETLHDMLTGAGYSLNAATDQRAITSWNGDGTKTVNFLATFINRVAGATTTLGYYANNGSFTPVFTEAPNAATPASVAFSVPSLSSIIFGINTTFNNATNNYTTDPAQHNTDGSAQHALVYHPSADEYVMGYEDLPLQGADKDYNDMTVSVKVNSCTPTPPPQQDTANLHATKVVCDSEQYLPNWGSGTGPDITATTASDFIAASNGHCHLQDGWSFQWAPSGTSNPGDNGTTAAGSPWTSFGPTVAGTITAQVPVDGSYVWAREVLQNGYVPFSYSAHNNDSDNVSAEMYCNTDHLHYDNYDRVDSLQAGKDYYCVAFNAPTGETPPPTDVCPNIEGNQATVPDGYTLIGNQCVQNQTGGPNADLSVAKTVDDATPDVGQNVIYTITAHNNGPDTATNVTISDSLPAGVTYVSDDGAGAYATSTGMWTIPSLANDTDAVLHITASVDSGTKGETITNAAAITHDDATDGNVDNNSAAVPVTVNTDETGSTDVCPNIGGDQATVPSGMHLDDGQCVNNGGGGGGSLGGWFAPANLGGGGGSPQGQVLGASCGLYLEKHIKFGSPKNDVDQVKKLQAFLNKWMGTNLPITGFYGPATLAAVNAFQAKYGDEILKPWGISSPTGLVYLSTLRQINLLECPDLQIQLPTLIPWSANPNAQ